MFLRSATDLCRTCDWTQIESYIDYCFECNTKSSYIGSICIQLYELRLDQHYQLPLAEYVKYPSTKSYFSDSNFCVIVGVDRFVFLGLQFLCNCWGGQIEILSSKGSLITCSKVLLTSLKLAGSYSNRSKESLPFPGIGISLNSLRKNYHFST